MPNTVTPPVPLADPKKYPTDGPFVVEMPGEWKIRFKSDLSVEQLDRLFNAGGKFKVGTRGGIETVQNTTSAVAAEVFDDLAEAVLGLKDFETRKVIDSETEPEWKKKIADHLKAEALNRLYTWTDEQIEFMAGGAVVTATVICNGGEHFVNHSLRNPSKEEKRQYDKRTRARLKGGKNVKSIENWNAARCDLYDEIVVSAEGYQKGVPPGHKALVISELLDASQDFL
jgi:hypothetical protein